MRHVEIDAAPLMEVRLRVMTTSFLPWTMKIG